MGHLNDVRFLPAVVRGGDPHTTFYWNFGQSKGCACVLRIRSGAYAPSLTLVLVPLLYGRPDGRRLRLAGTRLLLHRLEGAVGFASLLQRNANENVFCFSSKKLASFRK